MECFSVRRCVFRTPATMTCFWSMTSPAWAPWVLFQCATIAHFSTMPTYSSFSFRRKDHHIKLHHNWHSSLKFHQSSVIAKLLVRSVQSRPIRSSEWGKLNGGGGVKGRLGLDGRFSRDLPDCKWRWLYHGTTHATWFQKYALRFILACHGPHPHLSPNLRPKKNNKKTVVMIDMRPLSCSSWSSQPLFSLWRRWGRRAVRQLECPLYIRNGLWFHWFMSWVQFTSFGEVKERERERLEEKKKEEKWKM